MRSVVELDVEMNIKMTRQIPISHSISLDQVQDFIAHFTVSEIAMLAAETEGTLLVDMQLRAITLIGMSGEPRHSHERQPFLCRPC